MLSEAVARLGHKGGDENSNSEDRKNPTREEVSDYYYGSGVVLIILSLLNSLSN